MFVLWKFYSRQTKSNLSFLIQFSVLLFDFSSYRIKKPNNQIIIQKRIKSRALATVVRVIYFFLSYPTTARRITNKILAVYQWLLVVFRQQEIFWFAQYKYHKAIRGDVYLGDIHSEIPGWMLLSFSIKINYCTNVDPFYLANITQNSF